MIPRARDVMGCISIPKKPEECRRVKPVWCFFAVYVEKHRLVSSYSQVHETREMVGHQRDPLKVWKDRFQAAPASPRSPSSQ